MARVDKWEAVSLVQKRVDIVPCTWVVFEDAVINKWVAGLFWRYECQALLIGYGGFKGVKEIMTPDIFVRWGGGKCNRNQELRCMKFEETLTHLSGDRGDGSISYGCYLYGGLGFCDY